MGSGYVDNFQAGRIARVNAYSIYEWISGNDAAEAASKDAEVQASRAGAVAGDARSRDDLMDQFGEFRVTRCDVIGTGPEQILEAQIRRRIGAARLCFVEFLNFPEPCSQ